MSAPTKKTVSGEQNRGDTWTGAHLFGHQEMPIVRVYGTLPAVVHPIVFVHLPSWVVVLELKHDVREAVYGIKLFRCVFPVNLVEVHVRAYSPWWVRSPVRFQGRKRTHDEETG